jgi:hypothetical protein
MKRLVLTFVAVLALFSTVQTARADWVIEVNSDGWVVVRWDPAFDDGTFWNPPQPPPVTPTVPKGTLLQWIAGYWYLIYFNGIL